MYYVAMKNIFILFFLFRCSKIFLTNLALHFPPPLPFLYFFIVTSALYCDMSRIIIFQISVARGHHLSLLKKVVYGITF